MPREYEVVLGPPAERLINSLQRRLRNELVDALLTELADGPNRDKELKFDGSVQVCIGPESVTSMLYTATPLSVSGYTALHRPLTKKELKKLGTGGGRSTADLGFYVVEILPAESAFTRRLRVR